MSKKEQEKMSEDWAQSSAEDWTMENLLKQIAVVALLMTIGLPIGIVVLDYLANLWK